MTVSFTSMNKFKILMPHGGSLYFIFVTLLLIVVNGVIIFEQNVKIMKIVLRNNTDVKDYF